MTKSTLTTETITGVADLNAGYTLGHADVAILKALAAELLAVREAQSGWTNNGQADAALVMLDRIDTLDTDDDERIEEVKRIVRLLAAPPATAVPAAITADNAPEIFEIAAQVERIGLSGAYGAYASGWNACRAAMLAAAPTPTNQE